LKKSFETLMERVTSESLDIKVDHQQRAGASRLEERFPGSTGVIDEFSGRIRFGKV